jgi:hypothetical protein
MVNTVKNFFRNKYQSATDEHNRFGTISVLLIVVAIFGGIACGLSESLLALSIITAGTMLTEAFIIAVQPMKRIVNVSLISLVVNIIFIFIGFLG